MLDRLVSRFDPDQPLRGDGLLSLIISDYLAFYGSTPSRDRSGVAGSHKRYSIRKQALLFVPRVLHNPCLHATILIRLTVWSPRVLLGFWRTVLIAKHGIDIHWNMRIGPGLVLPHPMGIVLGWGLKIGRNATILHNVTIGGLVQRGRSGQLCPLIGDDVVIYMNSIILGPISIGDRAVVGAGSWVDRDISADTVHRGRGPLYSAEDLA